MVCSINFYLQEQNRRFRVKFAQTPSCSATEACKNCITTLAPLLPIREMDAMGSSVTSIPDSQIPTSYDDSQQILSQPASLAIQQTVPDSQPLVESQESQALYATQSNTSQSTVARSNAEDSHAMSKETDKSISIPDIAKVRGCLSIALL